MAQVAAVMRRTALAAGLSGAVLVSAGCAQTGLQADDGRVQVAVTTPLLADLVESVGGDAVNVSSLVPPGADPHSHEPSLRAVRDAVYADIAFSTYLMLEEQSIIKALDANLDPSVPNVRLAEDSGAYRPDLLPMVENVNLDTIWLGLRATGDAAALGGDRSSTVDLAFTSVDGPGSAFAYLTGSLGETEVHLDSSNGVDPAVDRVALPPGAHTHMSWVFDRPGVYEIGVRGSLESAGASAPIRVAEGTLVVAVGVAAAEAVPGREPLDSGHADLAVDLDSGSTLLRHDPDGTGASTRSLSLDDVVVEVPNIAIDEVPGDPRFRFLGRAGTDVWQLPQAVLGKHVHGEIDPHAWLDVHNVIAFVQTIRDELIAIDPARASTYAANADDYLDELDLLDADVRAEIGRIPDGRRHLVTTHDAFGYLAHAYGLRVAGFVTPNPGNEPSLADRRKLATTIENLRIPAVFLEPSLRARASTLVEIADDAGVEVCTLYGDTFDEHVDSYLELMRFNARSLRTCLS